MKTYNSVSIEEGSPKAEYLTGVADRSENTRRRVSRSLVVASISKAVTLAIYRQVANFQHTRIESRGYFMLLTWALSTPSWRSPWTTKCMYYFEKENGRLTKRLKMENVGTPLGFHAWDTWTRATRLGYLGGEHPWRFTLMWFRRLWISKDFIAFSYSPPLRREPSIIGNNSSKKATDDGSDYRSVSGYGETFHEYIGEQEEG